MIMKSMTGYGYASHSEKDWQLEIELKSYNNRYLDITAAMNSQLSCFEQDVVTEIRKHASRGKVDISVRLKVLESDSQVCLDRQLLRQYIAALRQAEEETGSRLELTAGDLLGIDGMFTSTSERNAERYESALFSCLESVLRDWDGTRAREGEATRQDLERLGRSMSSSLELISRRAGSYENYFRSLLLERYNELMLNTRFDETKMMQEVGALLVKYSVNEEINRLSTHLKEYFRLLESGESAGKKLDFLCQEMNREVNTTASKSQDAEITLLTVSMKDDIENIREQIRNIE